MYFFSILPKHSSTSLPLFPLPSHPLSLSLPPSLSSLPLSPPSLPSSPPLPGTHSQNIQVYDINSLEHLHTLSGHIGRVTVLNVTDSSQGDREYMFSGSSDSTVTVCLCVCVCAFCASMYVCVFYDLELCLVKGTLNKRHDFLVIKFGYI